MQSSVRNAGYILNCDLGTYEIEGRPVRENFSELAGRLRDVRDAFESRDYVLLADILKYEMPDVCRAWRALILSLSDQVEAPNNN